MIQHIGKIAEYFVLAELILKNIEAYPAISSHQEHYDITAIRPDRTISRIQVKATELNNKSTNNSVSRLSKDYDYLVLVVFNKKSPGYFILTDREAKSEFALNKSGTIYVSKRTRGEFSVRESIAKHKDCWAKITGNAA